MAHSNDDAFIFLDEPEVSASAPLAPPPWQVLLVDDEPDVHAATKLALKGLRVQGRLLSFSHAYSAEQACALLAQPHDFAVAFIDVVMETQDAGLHLVRHIRETLGNQALRIILRTGQPGYAPELETIQRYDINDYRTKAELTQACLFTSVTMAVRSFAQIRELESSRRGLEHILAATTALGKPQGLVPFARGIVSRLGALLQVPAPCLVCVALHEPGRVPTVLAASGDHADWAGQTLDALPASPAKTHLLRTLDARQHQFDEGVCLFFPGRHEQALVAYVDVQQPPLPLERGLLEVFSSSMVVAFENLQLYLDINELAFTDPLVRLPNRNALLAHLETHPEPDGVLALLDLDGFADINNVLDDRFGDAVLCAVARQLHTAFGTGVMVARVGGDLFGLYGAKQDITPERIAQVFAQPLALHDAEPLRLSATAGLVHLRPGGDNGVTVLQHAGAALKQAKRVARGKAIYFEPEQADAARSRIRLLNRLRAAFSGEHLVLYYQPFVHLASGRVVGAECLLRWRGADGRFVPPDQFIPLAEQSGLMTALGEWVVRTALQWRRNLQDHVDDDFRVAINVSQVQFAEPDFVPNFLAVMHELGVPGRHIEVELTESVAIGSVEQLVTKLEQLREQGVRVAMDDFGTGYSSLNILQRLTLDRLKIDRSFVSGEEAEDNAFEIARTILTLADHLRLATIAEGIETQDQHQALMAAGCEEGQGYFFSRPLAEEDFLQWLQKMQATFNSR